MFDISRRLEINGATVAELMDILQHLPSNAVVSCCGDSIMYIHVDRDLEFINIDCEDLDEEYIEDEKTSYEEYWKARDSKSCQQKQN